MMVKGICVTSVNQQSNKIIGWKTGARGWKPSGETLKEGHGAEREKGRQKKENKIKEKQII